MTNSYLKQYQKNEVETASPEKILILLYNGAIQFLNKAKIALKQKNIQEIHNNIMGCENIIAEFMNTLNRDANPELADNLFGLYQYLYNTLVEANMQRDINKVEEVLGHLTGLRDTWLKAINLMHAQEKEAEEKALKAAQSSASTSGSYYSSKDYGDDDDDDDDEDDDDENSSNSWAG